MSRCEMSADGFRDIWAEFGSPLAAKALSVPAGSHRFAPGPSHPLPRSTCLSSRSNSSNMCATSSGHRRPLEKVSERGGQVEWESCTDIQFVSFILYQHFLFKQDEHLHSPLVVNRLDDEA